MIIPNLRNKNAKQLFDIVSNFVASRISVMSEYEYIINIIHNEEVTSHGRAKNNDADATVNIIIIINALRYYYYYYYIHD